MSFIRTKMIRGKNGKMYGPYAYEVENRREGGKVRQKVIRYIGRAGYTSGGRPFTVVPNNPKPGKTRFESPPPGDAPPIVAKYLDEEYQKQREKWAKEHPDDIENKENKERSAKIAWTVAEKRAAAHGWIRDPKTEKWKKKTAKKKPGKFKEKIPGGLAAGKKPEDFNQRELKRGQKVEMEHTKDKSIALEIAMDHLTEDKDYYKKLAKIEKPMGKVDKSAISWLTRVPATDLNFISHLESANVATLNEALEQMEGKPGNKGRMKKIKSQIKKLEK